MKPETTALLGQQIGHIRVVDVLGEGGMGAVYAGFDATLQRSVALKAIRSEFRLNAEAKARFLREARILSQLDHPNVCRVHDFVEGEDCDLLVMELVQGRSLRVALREGLEQSARMRVATQLLDVLAAVHEQGVIHRDLKPENLMLTPAGELKVLDFGLARSADEDLAVSMMATAMIDRGGHELEAGATTATSQASGSGYVRTTMGTVLGTVGYMSPEQARGEAATAASDMYSLGLVLQELFTGQRPFEEGLPPQQLMARAAAAESLPVTGLTADLSRLIERMKSAAPGARPSARDARDRLHWIVDRPRRRRRRQVVAAVWLALTLLAAGMSVQSWRAGREAERANREARVAAEVSEFLVGLFRVSEPSESRGSTVTARELLDRGAERIESELAEEPQTRAKLLLTMGNVYRELGLYAQAESLVEDAVDLRRQLFGEDHPELAEALNTLGGVYQSQGRLDEATALFRQAVTIREQALGEDDPSLAGPLHNLALAYQTGGRYDEAISLLQRSLALLERAHGADHPLLASSLEQLANVLQMLGRYEEAIPLYRRALEVRRAAFGEVHPDVATSLYNLGLVYRMRGAYDEAAPLLEKALEIRTTTMGAEHPAVARALGELANVYQFQGRLEDSIPLYERALQIQERALGKDHPNLAFTLASIGVALSQLGRLEDAVPPLERALRIWQGTLGPDHPNLAAPLHALGEVWRAQGQADRAISLFGQALAISEKALGADHPAVAYPLTGLALVAIDQGRYDDAAVLLERALAIRDEVLPAGHPETVEVLRALAKALRAGGRVDEAGEVEARLTTAQTGAAKE